MTLVDTSVIIGVHQRQAVHIPVTVAAPAVAEAMARGGVSFIQLVE